MNFTHTKSRYADDSSVLDIIDGAVSAWYERTGCEIAKDEDADEAINKALGLPVCGSIRGLALDLADCSPDEIAGDVARGLDAWYCAGI